MTGSVDTKRRIAAIAAIPVLLIAAGLTVAVLINNSVAVVVGLVGVAVVVVAAWWFIAEPGLRKTAAPFVGLAGIAILVWAASLVFTRPDRVFVRPALILLVVAVAFALARYALMSPPKVYPTTTGGRSRPNRPVLLCNPWSGGGKVKQFGLVDLAESLGIEVVMLDHGLDLEQLTREAVANGADCLGMAGGDGSQALVASVAIEHDLPFVCIPAGTRNHFALDLSLNRNDPRPAMQAYVDAIERRVDYATVNDRLFVNNVSLGIYATIVQSDEYRDAKVEVSTSMMRRLLGSQAEPFDLQYTTPDGTDIDGAFLVMVSNNPYVLGPKLDISQRRQIDTGRLGVFAMSPRTGSQAARLITLSAFGLRNLSKHFYEFTPATFEVRSRSGKAYMGVDGEALEAETPLRFEIHPGGLRMYVPEGNLEAAEVRRARDLDLTDLFRVGAGHEPLREGPV